MSLTDLIKNVKRWSIDRGLDKASPIKQMQKLSEEWGELNAGEAKSNQEKIIDSIGDVMVVLTILSQQMNFEKSEIILDPSQNNRSTYEADETHTDILLLYGTEEIGILAKLMVDYLRNPSINTNAMIRFHIRNLAIYISRIAINEKTTLEKCFEVAWNEIKDRTGKMVDGVFVKQEDLEDGK